MTDKGPAMVMSCFVCGRNVTDQPKTFCYVMEAYPEDNHLLCLCEDCWANIDKVLWSEMYAHRRARGE